MPDSNWKNLKGKIKVEVSQTERNIKRKRTDLADAVVQLKSSKEKAENCPTDFSEALSQETKRKYVGLDCEMVGIGPTGKQSALARCCLVDFDGHIIYDRFVRPPGFVTDFRTKWSGVRKHDLRHGHAISLQECQKDVAALIAGKVLVGHALRNDLDVLMLSHPHKMIRDTSSYRPFMRPHGKKMRPRALRDLVKQHLGMTIQSDEHDPGEDARAAVMLYRFAMKEWEQQLRQRKAEVRAKALGLVTTDPAAQGLAGEKPRGKKRKLESSSSSSAGASKRADRSGEGDTGAAGAEKEAAGEDLRRASTGTGTNKRGEENGVEADQYHKLSKLELVTEENVHHADAVEMARKVQKDDRKIKKKVGGGGMFGSCSVDARGRALRSIAEVDRRAAGAGAGHSSGHSSAPVAAFTVASGVRKTKNSPRGGAQESNRFRSNQSAAKKTGSNRISG